MDIERGPTKGEFIKPFSPLFGYGDFFIFSNGYGDCYFVRTKSCGKGGGIYGARETSSSVSGFGFGFGWQGADFCSLDFCSLEYGDGIISGKGRGLLFTNEY